MGISPFAWLCVAVVGGLMALLYWRNIDRLWDKTNPFYGQNADNWSHSILVPVIGIIYLWLRRHDLREAEATPVLPTSRLPWLLGGATTLAFVAAGAWLFSRAGNSLPPALIPILLPAAGVLLGLAVVDVVYTTVRDGLRGAGLGRLFGGAAFLVLGVAGVLATNAGIVAKLSNETYAGYFGPLCTAVAFLGGLAILLDWGLACLVAGVLLSGYGIWPGQNDYLKDLGMVLAVFGAALTLSGWQVMRIVWFPIAFLVFAIPWPELVYTKVALPLQFLAARVAVVTMNLAQVETYVEGTRIIISRPGEEDRVLEVAQACAGMRSLMTFLTAGGAVAFLFGQRPLWQRLIIVVSAVPIAIGMNVLRVSGQGLLDVYVSEKFSEGFAHAFAGLVMLVPAFFLLLGVVWIVDHLLVEVDDEDDADRSTPPTLEARHA